MVEAAKMLKALHAVTVIQGIMERTAGVRVLITDNFVYLVKTLPYFSIYNIHGTPTCMALNLSMCCIYLHLVRQQGMREFYNNRYPLRSKKCLTN